MFGPLYIFCLVHIVKVIYTCVRFQRFLHMGSRMDNSDKVGFSVEVCIHDFGPKIRICLAAMARAKISLANDCSTMRVVCEEDRWSWSYEDTEDFDMGAFQRAPDCVLRVSAPSWNYPGRLGPQSTECVTHDCRCYLGLRRVRTPRAPGMRAPEQGIFAGGFNIKWVSLDLAGADFERVLQKIDSLKEEVFVIVPGSMDRHNTLVNGFNCTLTKSIFPHLSTEDPPSMNTYTSLKDQLSLHLYDCTKKIMT
eukprot:756749-Hanusia_phi.AAC.16